MSNETKEVVIVVAASLLLIWLLKPSDKVVAAKKDGSRKLLLPDVEDFDFAIPLVEDCYVALTAYISAYNDEVAQTDLDKLNEEIKKDMSIQVVKISENTLSVEDLKGNEILNVKV